MGKIKYITMKKYINSVLERVSMKERDEILQDTCTKQFLNFLEEYVAGGVLGGFIPPFFWCCTLLQQYWCKV